MTGLTRSELVTVFGGSGFIGTQVVRALAQRGWRVRVAVRNPNRAYKLQTAGRVGQIQIVQANVGVPDSVDAALEGASACVNLVGLLYETGSRKFQTVHVEGARNVAEACAAHGIEDLVHMSALGADPDSSSIYARTKGDGEQAVRRVIPGATIFRPSVVFGPEDNFFNKFASMAVMAPALPLPGGGKTRFQPVYVGDVAEAIAQAVDDRACAGKTYELAGPVTYTFKELMQIVLDETHRRRLLLPIPYAAASLMGLAGNIQAVLQPFAPAPVITSDQVLLLQRDNVVSGAFPGLRELQITPNALEAIVPTYLWRYRKGGQFAQPTVA
ncbi:complex I NDUFA9 subunit family protein [Caulobacter sp. 17J65-9]|uniref:complex I NDUFA9 subunit family protein n=1 Tax=Caulobacter sp. 17J65-9 TaxID=2709382 RepID=UPI0013C838A1|nr:complex I NDUFA9 subunit family protein [Caulobacter sp. 17J65-9]NEX93400.1 complex I NDUFA9 subunit family protein [Caulobacter sp. 17J65-9]